MKKNPKQKIKKWIPVILITVFSMALIIMFPENRENFGKTLGSYSLEMLTIFPAVLILMGLMSAFISNDFIIRHLGIGSGLLGMITAFILGSLPTGPLYMAFPLAATFKAKGARTANVVIFLSAWACIKIPQELVELRFMGIKFTAYRLIITIFLVTVMGLIVEKLEKRRTKGTVSSG